MTDTYFSFQHTGPSKTYLQWLVAMQGFAMIQRNYSTKNKTFSSYI